MKVFLLSIIIISFLIAPLYCQNKGDVVVSTNGKFIIIANLEIGQNMPSYSNFRLYKLPLDCSKFQKIEANVPICWNKEGSLFASNTYYYDVLTNSTRFKICIFDTTGFLKDSILNAVRPLFHNDYIFYIKGDEEFKIMKYDMKLRYSELEYSFDSSFTFSIYGIGIQLLPITWDYSWPEGLNGIIYKNGDEAEQYKFIVNNKNLIFWLKNNLIKTRDLPKEGFK